MAKVLLSITLLFAVSVAWSGSLVVPAQAHYPAYLWYHGYKYWRADYYDPYWCIYHHKYVYCRRHGGGGGGGY